MRKIFRHMFRDNQSALELPFFFLWHGLAPLSRLDTRTPEITYGFVKQSGGVIVNISTFSAFEPELTFPVSSSLRSGLASFTKLYANRYAAAGIRINNVLPGYMDNYPESAENLAKIPMKRYAKVQEIAKTVRFLLSDDAGYITGQNIRVDGGITHSI